MVNTLIASVIAGGIGILAASITQLDTETLPLQIVPALAGGADRAVHLLRDRLRRRDRPGDHRAR